MGKFYDTHKDLYNAKEIDETGTKYTRLNSNGSRTLEQWTKINGEWVDTTEQARLAEQIEAKKKDLRRQRAAAARKVLEEKRAKEGSL